MQKSLTVLVLAASFGIASAEEIPEGVGTLTPSASVFNSDITPKGDADAFVFQGYPGVTATITVKASKGSTLQPLLEIVRPGGEVVSDDGGLSLALSSKGATGKLVLNSAGWWQARVTGANETTGAYSVSIKYTTPKLPALPGLSKSFKTSASISPVGDTDDFAFQGYAGQALNATVTVAKTGTLDPSLQLIRPDGSSVQLAGNTDAQKKVVLARTLDTTGIWKIRVVGDEAVQGPPYTDLTVGPYSLSVSLGKPIDVGLKPDTNNQYRLAFPAVGGASVGYTLTFTGNAPTFNSFRDPTGKSVPGFPGGLSVKSFQIPPSYPIGEYVALFDAPAGAPPTNVQLNRTLSLPRSAAKISAKLDKTEPVIRNNGIAPTEGGPGTLLTVQVSNAVDPNAPDGSVHLWLGHYALTGVSLQPDGITVRGTVPNNLPEGDFDVVFASTSGQVTSKAGAFRRVPPPTVTSIDPNVGTEGGGFDVTITGTGFRPGHMGILLDGALQPVTIDASTTTSTSITFTAPSRAPGFVVFGVTDRDTQLSANLPLNSFEYVATPAVSRVIPALVPTLGNELVTVQGANFSASDTVYLETTPNTGVYTAMTTPQTPTFINSRQHRFTAPPRPKGVYRVYVQDSQGQPNPPKTRTLTYYSFADATGASNLGSLGSDSYDGYTNTLADYDKDGDLDIFVSRRGAPGDTVASASSLTRILRNDGNSQFADVTATTMPETGSDDWRADRIWVVDMNQDGYVDIAITTNTVAVPPAGQSHTRILTNEARGGTGQSASERVFRDSTDTLMAPSRHMSVYYGADYVSDDWRGLDMWIGDIDKGATAPPEIVIVHDEVKDDAPSNGVSCGNYCSVSQTSFSYAYMFYWGGSRLFRWDKSKKAGQGQYAFDANFFPRRSGPFVPTGGLPGGGSIPPCNSRYNQACKDTFTPFTGQRVAVSALDSDAKLDVAVLSNKIVQRKAKVNDPMLTTSSLQVGMNRFNAKEGSGATDITGIIFAMGGSTTGDAVTIGHPGYPDGGTEGVIAFTKAASGGGGSVLRLLKYKYGGTDAFDDITQDAMPIPGVTDSFQASQLEFRDIDQDGDEDLVLVANTAPSAAEPATRIFRNERVNTTVGNMTKTLIPLLAAAVTATEHFEGDCFTIGDVTGDGVLDYVLTRASTSGSGPKTRILRTDR